MNRIPFWRFIVTFLLFNKDISYIIEKLRSFGYNITEDAVKGAFSSLRNMLPESLGQVLSERGMFDIKNESHVQWLKHFGVFEYYDFIIRNKDIKDEDTPEYFKWCQDCVWVHQYKDVMTLMNILIFNDEPNDSISKIIMFKYKKKIGVDAIDLYKKMFWDCSSITAKEALYFCIPFQDNALIIRKLRSGAEIESVDNEAHDGSDVPFNFHDTNYIKWKIGYRDVSVPTSKDFLERVKQDSYFKYYEAMNMSQSIESEEESGDNDKLGAFNSTKITRKNVEEQRAKISKHWLEIYLKAEGAMPKGDPEKDDFFEKMNQLELDFEDDEGVARIEDVPDIMSDIKGDISQ